MKKILFVVFTLIFSIANAFSQKHYYEWENLKMNRLIKNCKLNGITHLKVSKIDYEYGVPLNWSTTIKDFKFDDNFNLIEENLWDEKEYVGKIIYKYNENQDTLLIKKIDKDNEEIYRIEFNYENIKLITKKFYDEGDLEYIEYYKYDDKNLLQEKKRLKDDELDFIEYYKYNEQNKLTEWYFFDEDSVEKIKSIISYTPLGLVSDSIVYFDGIEDAKFEYKYDTQGNLVEWIYSSPKVGLIKRKTYKYDLHKRLIEMRVFDDQDVLVELYYGSYDPVVKDRLIKLEIYGENEFLIGIWNYKYFDNELLKNEIYLNKLELPQFMNKYEYEPTQR